MKRFAELAEHGLNFVMKHRIKIFDLGLIIAVLATAALFAFELDVFENESRLTRRQETIELDELMVLTTLVMSGVLFYTWRRAREHQRENVRRLVAERDVLALAMQDPLTGLPNRRQFNDRLKAALNTAPVAPEAHAVFMIDLNGFKKINDLHGHPVGDEVLIHVSSRMLRAVRDGDLVARLGGDEFAVLARNVAGAEGAASIALRIIESLGRQVLAGGGSHQVGAAIGVALTPQDGSQIDEVLRKADVALYRAKAEAGSAVRFFEPAMDTKLRERAELERALRAAVEADQLKLRFRPVFNARDGRVTAFEAHPMWPHPEQGDLGPERLVPIAEEAGLIGAVTDQILRKACLAAAAWPSSVRLAVAVAGPQLRDGALGLRMLAILGETGFPPNRLDLEIDEGALIRDAEAAEALLTPIRAAGVSIVGAHFGTGYADLQNLHRLKLDRIKLDPSYVAAMTHDKQAAVMVKALIGIGQGLDLTIIADGVTTEEQQAALTAQGCEQVQGGLYSEPMSAEEAAALTRAIPGKSKSRVA